MLQIIPKVPFPAKYIFVCVICLVSFYTNGQNGVDTGVSGQEKLSDVQENNLRESAEKKFKLGDFRDAWGEYQSLLINGEINSDAEAIDFSNDLRQAITCLNRLGEQQQFDRYIEKIVQHYSGQWRMLSQAAESYTSVEKSGYIIGGEFQRGYHRGGGRYVNTFQRDRVRALQLYRRAWALLESELNSGTHSSEDDFIDLLKETANAFKQSADNQSWRLQVLTDLKVLPDYDEGYYGRSQLGAPVTRDGGIVVYDIPVSFDAAKNDGERWRYILQQISSINEDEKEWSQWAWADFLWQQYGVQTMAQSAFRYFTNSFRRDFQGNSTNNNSNASEAEKSIFDLQSLPDTETIAKLATGIKRFSLPNDYNFIAYFEQLSNSSRYQASALERLATIYENRRQLPKAAEYWRKLIAETNSNNTRYQQRLSQIVGAWALFEPLSAQVKNDSQQQVGLRFRNATNVKLTAHRIDSKKLIDDIKSYLASDPNRLEWQKLNIANIGRQIINGDSGYQGRILRSWTQALQPPVDDKQKHQDKYVSIDLPSDIRGAYLLEAEVAGGNTNYIVVWNSESIIVKKPMENGQFYFVADSLTGKPLRNQHLSFYGYHQDWKNIETIANGRRQRELEILTKEFVVKTDRQGQVIVDEDKVDPQYQWLVHTNPNDDEFAFLGFNSIWYGRSSAWQQQQTKAYIVSNQPAYRPGQKIEISAWVQTASYNPQEKNQSADQSYQVRIHNPKGEKIAEQQLASDKFGGISYSLQLPDDATLGVYGIEIVGVEGYGQFRVEEYKKPEYEVLIEAPDKPVALGETITAKVKANYYFGAPVVEAKVKIKVERFEHSARWFPHNEWDWLYGNGYWWFASDMDWYPGWQRWGMQAPIYSWMQPSYGGQPELIQETEVDIGVDGSADIVINTEAAKLLHGDKDHRYHISVEIIDNSRRSVYGSGDVLVSRQPYQVFAWVDKGYYQIGDTVEAQFQAQSLDQKPVQGSGKAELYKIRYNNEIEGESDVTEILVEQWELDNDEEGHASLSLNAKEAGQHRHVYRLVDEQGNSQEGAYLFNVVAVNSNTNKNSYRFNDLELIAERTHYSSGDELELLVNSNHDDAHVLLFERPTGNYQKPLRLTLNGHSKKHTIKLDEKDHPNIFVEALTVHNGEVFSVVKEIAIPPEQSLINVDIDTNKEEFKPGEEAEIELTLTDQNGETFQGSTIITVYDKALDYIAGGVKPPPIREFFWDWKRYHQPTQENSAQRQFYSLVKDADQAMQFVGVFGDRVHQVEVDTEEGIQEIVVTASKRGASRADSSVMLASSESVIASDSIAINGSSEPGAETPQIAARSDFADSAYWISHLHSDDQGKATVKFTLPDNLTTWLTSAWAIGEKAQVGQASKELVTKKNLLLRLQAPRFFIEKDEVVLSANVHNYLESNQDIKVSLQLDGDEIVLVEGEDLSQSINIRAGGEQRIDWRIKVKQEGLAKIRMLAVNTSTEGESDGVAMSFPVYVHGQLLTQSYSGSLNRNESLGVIEFTVPAQRRPEQSRLELRYSPTLAGAMVDALPYLVDFPYGCTEQTLSRFLPTVMVQNILQKSNINLEAIKSKQSNLNAQEIGDDQERATNWQNSNRNPLIDNNPVFDVDQVKKMSITGINRLNTMQLSDGGWGWFSGWGERSSPHTTAYVVHGIQIAKNSGLSIDENGLQRGIQWLQHYQAQELQKLNNAPGKIRPYKTKADNLDAFVAMVLTDSGNSSKPLIDVLYRDRLQLAVYGQSILALTLNTLDRTAERDIVRKNIEQFLVVDDENQTAYLKLENTNYWWYWYGSEYEAQAYYLKLLAKIDPNGETAPRLVKYLLNNRRHANYWNSTRDTAIVIEAMSDYLLASGEATPDITLEIKLDGETVKTVSIEKENLFDFDNKLVIEGLGLSAGDHRLEIVKTGSGPLYYNAYVNNFSLEDKLEKQGLEIKVERRYYQLTPINSDVDVAGSAGQAIKQSVEKYQRTAIKEKTALNSGDLIEIELLIDSKNDYEYILIEDMKAAGFESISVQSGYSGNELGAYVEYRDNRVAFFVQNLARGSHSLRYRMKAEIPGKFSALPTKVEAMYAPELKANSDENKLLINE